MSQTTENSIIVNGTSVPVIESHGENGELFPTLSFESTIEVLGEWRAHDPEHRYFGWASDAVATRSEDVILAYPHGIFVTAIRDDGTLQTTFLEPFYDGRTVLEAYVLGDIAGITGIDLNGGHRVPSDASPGSDNVAGQE